MRTKIHQNTRKCLIHYYCSWHTLRFTNVLEDMKKLVSLRKKACDFDTENSKPTFRLTSLVEKTLEVQKIWEGPTVNEDSNRHCHLDLDNTNRRFPHKTPGDGDERACKYFLKMVNSYKGMSQPFFLKGLLESSLRLYPEDISPDCSQDTPAREFASLYSIWFQQF